MYRHRAPLLLVVGLVLGVSALSAFMASRSPAEAAGEDVAYYEFVLVETTRTDRGGRNPRAGLKLYRFAEFDYRDAYFDRLEEFFEKYKEPIGIHHLLMAGFRLVQMERENDTSWFVVQVRQDEFARFLRGK